MKSAKKRGVGITHRLLVTVVLCVAVVLVPIGAWAQSAGSAFTYQGQLKEGGMPADGRYDFLFTLYDDLGAVVSGPIPVEDHPVTNGLFSVILDFESSPFTGDARFLEIAVRPGSSTDHHEILSPQQELTPTPYAATALNTVGVDGHSLDAADGSPVNAVYVTPAGDVGVGTTRPSSKLDVNGTVSTLGFNLATAPVAGHVLTSDASGDGTWQAPSGDSPWQRAHSDIYYNDGNVGIGTSSPDHLLHVTTASGSAIAGHTTDGSGDAAGVRGETASPSGRGVFGYATSTLVGEAHGVHGEAKTWGGHGVHGVATGHNGNGVYGYASSRSGTTYGIYGIADSSSGRGVYGEATGDSAYGGYFVGRGYFSGNVGIGVEPDTASLKVDRASDMDPGYAINGTATANSGINVGVRGQSLSPDGRGLEGVNYAGGWAGYFQGQTYISARLGIRTENPTEPLDVDGTAKMTGFRLTTTPSAGYVLTSDANGVGTWQESIVFELPYEGTVSDTGAAFKITNSGEGNGSHAIFGKLSNASVSGEAAAGFFTAEGTYGTALIVKASSNYAVDARNSSVSPTIQAINDGAGPGLVAEGPIAAKLYGNVEIYEHGTYNKVVELGKGLDYAEGFDVSTDDIEIKPGTVLIIDPHNPGELAISTQAYDRKVAGIIAGANGLGSGVRLGGDRFDHNVALAGRVYCNVVATDDPIEPGDLLTTSDVPGFAMKVTDHQRAQGAILGKAMEPLAAGRMGQILVLVMPQ